MSMHRILHVLKYSLHVTLSHSMNTNGIKPMSSSPRYRDMIPHPMCLDDMQERVVATYVNYDELRRDYDLIKDNCVTYNGTESHLSKTVIAMNKQGHEWIKRHELGHLEAVKKHEEYQSPPAGGSQSAAAAGAAGGAAGVAAGGARGGSGTAIKRERRQSIQPAV